MWLSHAFAKGPPEMRLQLKSSRVFFLANQLDCHDCTSAQSIFAYKARALPKLAERFLFGDEECPRLRDTVFKTILLISNTIQRTTNDIITHGCIVGKLRQQATQSWFFPTAFSKAFWNKKNICMQFKVSTSIHNISQSTCLSEYGCADAFYWGSYIWKYYWERLCQYSCHYISALRTCVANGAPMRACDSFSFAFVVLHVFLFRSGYELLLERSEEDFFVGTIRLS